MEERLPKKLPKPCAVTLLTIIVHFAYPVWRLQWKSAS